MTGQGQQDVIAFLATAATHGGIAPVEVMETHISIVFLAGDRALKLKRAVRLPYTDASTPEKRLANCRKEYDLNRSTAPDLYLGVRRITRDGDGALRFDGAGALVDAVVEMVRFDQADLFDRMAERGALTAAMMDSLATVIARHHDAAPVVHAGSGRDNIAAVLDINRAGFATSDVFEAAAVERLDTAFRRGLDRRAAVLDAREAAGRVRRCHGDLHLRNICLFEGRPTLFDCIEFSDRLATVDVLYDLAFLLMDLWHRDLPGLANLVANRYCDAAAEEEGFALLPYFMALRAAVRAHVTATFAADAGDDRDRQVTIARGYFDLAEALLPDAPARVVAIGGLSGSGKTTVAEALAPRVGAPPGARLVESDRLRKAIFGVAPETRLPAEAYRPDLSDRVYAELGGRARRLAEAGASVIAHAVFDRAARRQAFETAVAGHACAGLWLTADPDVLRARVGGRAKGPSDATPEVLEAQLQGDPGPLAWHRLSSEGRVADTVAAAAGLVEAETGDAPGPAPA